MPAPPASSSGPPTEAMKALILQYNRLKSGDAVLYADLDYDSMQTSMDSLGSRRGVRVIKIAVPEPATRQSLVDAYRAAFDANPAVKMALLTHVSHRTGLVLPVAEIAVRLKLGPKAAESLLVRARTAFRECFAAVCGGQSNVDMES